MAPTAPTARTARTARTAHARRLRGALAALLLGATTALPLGVTAAPAAASPAAAPTAAATDLAGTVALGNCSGALVRTPDAGPDDPALVLTNGHCLESGMPEPGRVIVDRPSSRSLTLLAAGGREAATLRTARIVYATMTGTDLAVYRLTTSYREIEDRHGVRPLEIAAARGTPGARIDVVSGYWKRVYSCRLDGFVHELHEDGWVMRDSLRYTSGCDTAPGTSGAPVVDRETGRVIGVNSTANRGGTPCALHSPCEVDGNGDTTTRRGIAYGQQVHALTGCVTAGGRLDLTLPACTLPKP
ncbi:trypsin-like peptidase domain-containing protein [Streptomyces durbertensis]|uniref:Trypsin-like peptidase domain-containing protein n=1 Tax=Streptomyces durbertensis TaxID=2448886 RepID=A0ABR6EL37_9ACTN|nr:serine protease [Streptomyces durbertensis]MBB1246048.1 trypsin-like peptidase domain-containing protein [Streptomyces durbertensis]